LSCAATLNNRGSKQKNGCADIVQPFLFCLILPYFALFCLILPYEKYKIKVLPPYTPHFTIGFYVVY